MRKFLVLLSLQLLLSAACWADSTNPPAPPSLPEGVDMMPPPADQSSTSPVSAPPASALKALDQAQPTPSSSEKAASPSDSLDTGGVAPPPAPEDSSETKTSKSKAAPTPTAVHKASPTPIPVAPLKDMTLSNGAAHSEEEKGTQGGGTLADYFPVSEGMKWSYQYMDAGAKVRDVQCSSLKAMPNGTQRVVLDVTEGKMEYRVRYSIYDNKVEHTATADKQYKDNFAFKLPAAGESVQWSQTLPGGVVKHFKAMFATGNGREKAYPDCLVVVEKSTKAKKAGPITISYYGKGIGLVALETYSPEMKLLPEKSFALSGASADTPK